jgi:cytochrome oxidase assembly protein ShyY1
VFRTALRPRWLALLVLVLVTAALMARLGRWQWDRAHDNADANVAASLARPAVPIGAVLVPQPGPVVSCCCPAGGSTTGPGCGC